MIVRIAKNSSKPSKVRAQFGGHRVWIKQQDQCWKNGGEAVHQFYENNKELNETGPGQKQAVD